MAWFFKKRDEEKRELQELNHQLSFSFGNIKRDMNLIFQWLNYLNQKDLEQATLIRDLQLQLKYMPKTKEEIKQMLESDYPIERVLENIQVLNKRVETIANAHEPILNKVNELTSKIEHVEKPKIKEGIREKILRRITRNSKDYIKNTIRSLIAKYEKIGAMQLREIIVEEQKICSKSSFYRLLEEVEKDEEIAVIKEGKEKYYLSKIMKQT